MSQLKNKMDAVKSRIRALDKVAVAFSGGVDSTLLAALALEALGRDRVLAVGARHRFIARRDHEHALAVAGVLGGEHLVLDLDILAIPEVAEGSNLRCYHCKKSIMSLVRRASDRGAAILDGTNADDDPLRPGRQALREFGVLSPLAECGVAKAEIRSMARSMGLPGHDRPSNSCLATRLPTGRAITTRDLELVETLEDLALDSGLGWVRAKLGPGSVTILAEPRDMSRAFEAREAFSALAARFGIERLDVVERK